jgi:poly-gamma-glutamate capsule biosynthesis protein CapA/YwtB (metallophosphatase superfamily)
MTAREQSAVTPERDRAASTPGSCTLFLCGDVMLGRGIDQIMACPSDPSIYEPYATSALDYVRLAEEAHGAIPRGVGPDYVWGDLLVDLAELSPAVRIANLETAVTTSQDALPKGVNYRLHPQNAGSLLAAKLDCCVLANNHVLDWGPAGLIETLATLERVGIGAVGAGRSAEEASRPASIPLPGGRRLLLFAFGSITSGIPRGWAAAADRPGVALLPDLGPSTAERTAQAILESRCPGDLVIVSIHWGLNWGYEVPPEQRAFAHALIDAGACDVLHGHSSHHPRPLELYRERLILYGCGDFLNDYEGISGYEQYRGDLVLAYLPTLSPAGALDNLSLLAYQIRQLRLRRAEAADAAWLCSVLNREGAALGCELRLQERNRLLLRLR